VSQGDAETQCRDDNHGHGGTPPWTARGGTGEGRDARYYRAGENGG